MENKCTCERPDDNTCNYCEQQSSIQILEQAAENYAKQFDYAEDSSPQLDFIEGAKWQQEQNNTSKVNRVEVIQHSPPHNGRAYTNYNAKDVEIQFQDDGRTLKIFLK
jgi:hypothetical protein